MGLVDCTYGLTEVWYDVHRGLRRRGAMGPPYLGDSARAEEQERQPWPEWMLPTPATAVRQLAQARGACACRARVLVVRRKHLSVPFPLC